MKQILSLLLILSAFAPSAFARIGETEEQIEKRFGKSVVTFSKGKELPNKGYLSAGLRITVSYVDGISESEFYQKSDQQKLSQTEIDTLLDANSGGGAWAESPQVLSSVREWKCESTQRTAAYVEFANALTIGTDRCWKLQEAQKAQAEKDKLKGF
jgi:hypothetical protein